MHYPNINRQFLFALVLCAASTLVTGVGVIIWPTASLSVVQKYLRPHQDAMFHVAEKLSHRKPLPRNLGREKAFSMTYRKISDDGFQLEEKIFFWSRLVLTVQLNHGAPMYTWDYYPNSFSGAQMLYSS